MSAGSQGFNYTHLSGAGTTNILVGLGVNGAPANAGLYGGISVNTAGTTVTVTDGNGGTTIQGIGAVTGMFAVPDPGTQLKVGLTVVIVGAADVTVFWR